MSVGFAPSVFDTWAREDIAMARSEITAALREAQAACAESAATGMPIDEVSGQRAQRRADRRQSAAETVHAYNDAVKMVRERGAPGNQRDKAAAVAGLRQLGRRDFLKGTGRAAAGLTAAALAGRAVFEARPAWAGSKQPNIAIIGAGLAGIRAAHVLWTKYGWKPVIYEATTGIGGRCETLRGYWANGLISEIHGEFISSEHSSMLNLVTQFSFGLDDTGASPPGTVDTYWVNGARYTQAQLDADWQSWAWSLFNNAVHTVPWPQSYNSYNATGYQWDHMSVPQWIGQYVPGGTAGNFGALCLQDVIDEYGGDPSDQSALNLPMLLGYDDSAKGRGYQSRTSPLLAGTDERWHVTGGNDQIVTAMVNQLPAGTIQPSRPLLALKANASGTYTLTLGNGGSSTQVTVDSVILALPFTALRKVDLSQAGLSPLKMTAINTLGMGTTAKIMMQFSGEPWIADGFTGTTDQDNGFISSGWQMVQSAASGGYAGPVAVWNAFPGGTDTQSIVTNYGLTAGSGVPPAKLVSDLLAQLEPVLPGVTTAYAGRAWYDFGLLDPYLQGGYSYWRVGQYTGFSGYEGVQEGRIHFAGEHTTQNFQGFMEGAIRSGERCASEVWPNG
jgi:monoamine oxidase